MEKGRKQVIAFAVGRLARAEYMIGRSRCGDAVIPEENWEQERQDAISVLRLLGIPMAKEMDKPRKKWG